MFSALAKGDLTETIVNEYSGTFGRLKDDANTTVEQLTALQNPDFAAYARAFGGHGVRVERTEEFAPALAHLRTQALATRLPALLHCLIDPEAITPTRSLSQIRGG